MKLWQQYIQPDSIESALSALDSAPAPVRIIAGGTDLMLDLQQGRQPPVHTLVDISTIPALTCLERRQDALFIGAAVPVARLAGSDLVRRHAAALLDACELIAGPQVRNVATLGGNVAHALPAADGSIALMCLDAQAEVADLSGTRRVAMQDLFTGPGESALRTGRELLTGFHIPLATDGQASAFQRVMRLQGIALPILNLSLWLERGADVITSVRIACGPSGPTPRRLEGAEAALTGNPPDETHLARALAAVREQVSFRTSRRRATSAYRGELVAVLLKQTLAVAWERAGASRA